MMLAKVILALLKHVIFPASQYVHAIEGFTKLKQNNDGHPAWLSENIGGTQPAVLMPSVMLSHLNESDRRK